MERVELCDLCGAPLAEGEAVADLEDAPLVRCRGCGLVVTSPRPTPDELPGYYREGYYAHVAQAPSLAGRVIAKLKAYRGGYPSTDAPLARAGWRVGAALLGGAFLTTLPHRGAGRRLLDIGCGSGKALRWAAELGWEVYGVEWSEEAVRHARATGLERVRHGTVEEQRYPDDFFDAVTLYQVLEHVYSPTAVLREVRRILAPDGSVWISVPNFASYPRRLLGTSWYGLDTPIHLHHFTLPTLTELAARTGFRVATVRHYSRAVTLYTTWTGARARLSGAGSAGGRLREVARLLRRLAAARRDPTLRFSDILLVELRRTEAPLPAGRAPR